LSVFKNISYICNVKHSEIKDRIVETASNLFYKKGYNSTGINEIIATSGIAKATLYSHFRSKEDICLAYLQFKNTRFLNDIGKYAKAQPKGKTQLLALFDFLQLFFQDNDFNGCWCVKTVAEIPMENEKIRNEIQVQKLNFLLLIEKLITDNLKSIEANHVSSLAKKVYLLYEGAISESHLHGQDWPIKEARELCNLILT